MADAIAGLSTGILAASAAGIVTADGVDAGWEAQPARKVTTHTVWSRPMPRLL